MMSIAKIDIAANHECSSMTSDQKEALQFALDTIQNDTELIKAIQLFRAVMTIDKFEHHAGANCVLRFIDQLDELNDAPYDDFPGTLPDLLIRAGEMVKAELETL